MFSPEFFSLKGKKAIVTGGTRGLCLEIAKAYHDMGAEVVIWGRSESGYQTAAANSTEDALMHFVACDLSRSESIADAVQKSRELLGGRIDILVNGAGIQYREDAVNFPEDAWRNVIETNLTALFLVSQQVGRIMCDQKYGKIINIASMCSFFGSVRIPAYSASKGGVMQLTKALSNEWASFGVNVNAIAPGYMETELTRNIKTTNPPQYAEITSRIPAGRWGQPSDLQGAAVFLASDAAAYVTGAILPVDGGYLGK